MELNSARIRHPIHIYIQSRARVLAVLSLLGLLLPLASPLIPYTFGAWTETLIWLIDLGTHWQWFYLASLLLFGALAALGDRRWAIILLAMPLPWLTASPSAPQTNGTEASLTLMSANLHLDNADARPLLRLLAQHQPDVLVLLELSPEYAKQLNNLDAYPHRQINADNSPFGMGLLSRYPLRDVRIVHDEDGIPTITAELDMDGKPLRVIAFHPMPPLEPRFHTARNVALKSMARDAQHHDAPTVIVGDFNATPWSSALTGLDTLGFRRASSLEGTWPAALGVMGLPLDQVLVSKTGAVESFRVIDGLGSDHRATLTQLRFVSPPAPKTAPQP